METLLRPSPFLVLSTFHPQTSYSSLNPPFFSNKAVSSSRKVHDRIKSSKFDSVLDLEPTRKSESLDFDVSWIDPSDHRSRRFDLIIIGAGPAGLSLAEQASRYGIRALEDWLDRTWPMSCVYINDHKTRYLDRAYGRVRRKELKLKLLNGCVSNEVKFHKAKVWKIEHQEFESSVVFSDGSELKASLIVDASGFTSHFIEYDKPRNHGYQIAHGILAEVDDHPFDLDEMVLMDWRDSHLGNEPYLQKDNSKYPTFLYAMPFSSNLTFLEETSLVSRPVLSYMDVKKRMVARLRHLGIKVKSVIEVEKWLIPMGGPLPRIPQSVMAIGGDSGIVHPSTAYRWLGQWL
ncbi:hypothetical protein ACH5RR_021155 [Cinchona calisaya]|uniref:Lycopene beta-cyclase n=1 Tax=Cinchona calisaya TaxID=153742 RepID=A0ABD2ZGH9_9GENT